MAVWVHLPLAASVGSCAGSTRLSSSNLEALPEVSTLSAAFAGRLGLRQHRTVLVGGHQDISLPTSELLFMHRGERVLQKAGCPGTLCPEAHFFRGHPQTQPTGDWIHLVSASN